MTGSARRRALTVLMDVTENGAYANLSLKEALAGLNAQDAAFLTALVYITLEHLRYIDFILAAYARGRLTPTVRNILRLGAAQILYLNVPDSAACDESVKLARQAGKAALTGYVNGVLRNICRSKDALPALPEDPAARLAILYSWPDWLVADYLSQYGPDFTEVLLAHPATPGMTLRPHPPYTVGELQAELSRRGVPFSPGRYLPDAVHLPQGLDIAADPLYLEGKVAVQGESAMLACRAVGAAPGMTILDACAAPGGKSAYLAAQMQNQGKLLCYELHEHRADLMRKTFARLGVSIADIQLRDAAVPDPALAGTMDAVLADVPCSGFGVIGKPDVRLRRTREEVQSLAALQGRILAAVSQAVRPGGALVYATCTISRAENEDIVNAFLARNAAFSPDLRLAQLLPEALAPRARSGMIQLFPHLDGTDGFFIARMVRA